MTKKIFKQTLKHRIQKIEIIYLTVNSLYIFCDLLLTPKLHRILYRTADTMLLEFSVFHNFTTNTNFFCSQKKFQEISNCFQVSNIQKQNVIFLPQIPTNHRQLSGCVYFQTNQSDLSVQIITKN